MAPKTARHWAGFHLHLFLLTPRPLLYLGKESRGSHKKKIPNTMSVENHYFREVLIFLTALTLTILIYLPALWARHAFSGRNFSNAKYWIALIYNLLCMRIHKHIIRSSTLPFWGEIDNSITGWLSFLMYFIHGFSMPSKKEKKYGLFRKKENIPFDIWKDRKK